MLPSMWLSLLTWICIVLPLLWLARESLDEMENSSALTHSVGAEGETIQPPRAEKIFHEGIEPLEGAAFPGSSPACRRQRASSPYRRQAGLRQNLGSQRVLLERN